MIDHVLSFISVSRILELPAMVMIPGIAIILLLLVSALRSLFSLRILRAFNALIMAFVIAVILSQAGEAIVQLIGIEEESALGDNTGTGYVLSGPFLAWPAAST